jgi:hypothetical protein
MKIKIIIHNYAYYKIIQLRLRYQHPMIVVLLKTSARCIKNSYLSKLFDFFKIFGRITTYYFVKIIIITPNYTFYKIVQLKY